MAGVETKETTVRRRIVSMCEHIVV